MPSFLLRTVVFCVIFSALLFIIPASLEQGQERLEHTESLAAQFSRSQLLFRTGYSAFQQGSYQETIDAFRRFVAEEPESLLLEYAYCYIARSQIKLGQYKEARTLFTRIQQTFPHSVLLPDIAFLIANSYYVEGNYETAIQLYLALKNTKQYKNHRWLPEIYVRLGHCYEQTNQLAAARKIYHEARFTFITNPIYSRAKEHEQTLLTQHPSLRQHITVQERLRDVDALLKYGRAGDAAEILAEFSQQQLSSADQQKVLLKLGQAHYALRENEQALEYFNQFLKKYPTSKMVTYVYDRIGRLHLRRQDMAAFLTTYDQLRTKYPASQYTAAALRLKGKELQLQGKYKEALTEFNTFMKSYPKSSLVSDILWNIGWANYRLQHYNAALNAFSRLVRSYPKSYYREEALYWAGKSAEHSQSYAQAGDYYLKLMNENRNSYYGVLSRQALARLRQQHHTVKFSQTLKEVTPLAFDQIAEYTTDLGKLHQEKSQAFASMHLFALAAEELASAIDNDKPDHTKYLELAQLYRLAEDYHQLARLMQSQFWEWIARGDDSLPQTFWELAYPLSFFPIVQQFTASGELDPLAVTALMFAESVFDPKAYSPAGAMGLMQLMPATGSRMAAVIGIPAPTTLQYSQPNINIALGTTYLKMLSQLFDRQLLPVIAGYNAGEEVVSTWWKDEYRQNEPAFVASIPYQETKRYVQKVLWYYREYQRIYQ